MIGDLPISGRPSLATDAFRTGSFPSKRIRGVPRDQFAGGNVPLIGRDRLIEQLRGW